jgi:ATP-dependent RNA helicase DHX29
MPNNVEGELAVYRKEFVFTFSVKTGMINSYDNSFFIVPLLTRNKLSERQTPEMLRLSLQDLVLRVKMCNLGGIEQTLSEALDPPSAKNTRRAIEALKDVKALTNSENLTPLGRQLARLPLDVFLGKLVLNGLFFQCLDIAVTIAAIMSSKSPFGSTFWSRSQVELARMSFRKGNSDLITLYNAYSAWRRVRASANASEFQFCQKNCLSPKALAGIEDLKISLCVALVEGGLLKLDAKSQASLNRYVQRTLENTILLN